MSIFADLSSKPLKMPRGMCEGSTLELTALAVPLMGRSEKDLAPEGISVVEDWKIFEY